MNHMVHAIGFNGFASAYQAVYHPLNPLTVCLLTTSSEEDLGYFIEFIIHTFRLSGDFF
jgi:hypothetical protein